LEETESFSFSLSNVLTGFSNGMGVSMSGILVTLQEVLANSCSFSWRDALYVFPGKPWSLQTNCIIHDVDDVEDDKSDLPNVVIEHGFEYVCGMQAVQSIVDNAKMQITAPSEEDYLAAFLFYQE
jgi:hypothetical protein